MDVSKDSLDYYDGENKEEGQFSNDLESIVSWLSGFDASRHIFVFEPTGTYGDKLLCSLVDGGFEIRLANPRSSHGFMKALGLLHKNDKNAAWALVRMGESIDLPVHQPKDKNMRDRKQVQMAYNALTKQKRQLSNQLHSLGQYSSIHDGARSALEACLGKVEQELGKLESELESLDDGDADHFKERVTSVKGLGPKSASLLLTYTNGFKMFDKVGSLLNFVGIVPSSHSSGSSVYKRGGMTKKGASQLRSVLYNAAKSAKRYNNACIAIYERLRKKGKPHKVAMVAVMKKLLQQAFAIVKQDTDFDNDLYLKNMATN